VSEGEWLSEWVGGIVELQAKNITKEISNDYILSVRFKPRNTGTRFGTLRLSICR
jgi:hypothetical protein